MKASGHELRAAVTRSAQLDYAGRAPFASALLPTLLLSVSYPRCRRQRVPSVTMATALECEAETIPPLAIDQLA